MKRPFGVVLVAALVFVSGLFDLILGAFFMLAPFVTDPALTNTLGQTQQISDFFLFVNGLLSFVLGLMYFWLTRMTLIGSQTAYVLINFLSILNIFFGLFRLPLGWGVIALSGLALILVNTRAARDWFTRVA
ncbi:MAG: hypothetical protein Q7V58_14575 [Actinomycetota bacterium]|nr:hypothetical protein [Actinomycetota bacterium]MDP1877290.1 hypothetical protein [Actinomycetota bacterium]